MEVECLKCGTVAPFSVMIGHAENCNEPAPPYAAASASRSAVCEFQYLSRHCFGSGGQSIRHAAAPYRWKFRHLAMIAQSADNFAPTIGRSDAFEQPS